MLTGSEILKRVNSGDIIITGFDKSRLNPNSYDLTLNKTLKVYTDVEDSSDKFLDMKSLPSTRDITIPDCGLVLKPGILYLGSTNEKTMCNDLIPCIDGKSSIGRLGIFTHITAGFGDVGFHGTWTLEITVVHPIRIYPNTRICQIYFYEPCGDTSIQYNGKYQYQDSATESRMFKDFEMEE